MRDFSYRICEDAEVYFYLYDANPTRQRQITERFLVKITKEGFSNYGIDTHHSNCTVFTDLGEFSCFFKKLILVRNGEFLKKISLIKKLKFQLKKII